MAVPGGTATVALDQVPTTLNDHTVVGDTAAGRMVASAVWAQVFRVGPGLTPQLDTNVVDSAEVVSLNPQTVVYKIDPRAMWSDGVPISAADFTYAWQSQRGGALDVDGTPDSVASTLGYRDIQSLTGSNDGRTVTVVFHTPFADWASLFDDLLPAHIAEQVGWNSGFDQFSTAVLVSGGPFEVVSWQPGSELVLGRNPRWWGSPPTLDRIVVRAVTGGGCPRRRPGTERADGRLPERVRPVVHGPGVVVLVAADPVRAGDDHAPARVQRAPRAAQHGHGAPGDRPRHRPGRHRRDLGQPENHSTWEDNDHLVPNVEPGYADDAMGYASVDPTASARLLEQSGFALDPTGHWTLHAKPVSLDLVWAEDDPWSAAVGPIVAAQLVAAGFDVVATPLPAAQLYGTTLPTGAFDLALVPVDATAYPSTLGSVFSTSPAVVGGAPSQDWSGFDDPKIDALFTQAAQELAPPQAHQIYQQIDQDLWTAMPTLPLFAEPTMLVSSASLAGVGDDPGGLGPLWNVRLWTLRSAVKKHSVTGAG